MKQHVLFLCIHNSARSQIAEAFLKKLGGDKFSAESAGIEGGKLNPFAIKVMHEEGIDISGNRTQTADELLKAGKTFDVVVTVCDEASAERCPVFPGRHRRLHWGFEDPSAATGSDEDKLRKMRFVKNQIKESILNFINEI